MNATRTPPRHKAPRKSRPVNARPVTELLLELTYHLYTSRVLARPAPALGR